MFETLKYKHQSIIIKLLLNYRVYEFVYGVSIVYTVNNLIVLYKINTINSNRIVITYKCII